MNEGLLKSAQIRINESKCVVCGSCVNVCAGGPLYLEDGEVKADTTRGFGCIACGHCMAICSQEAITIEGRDLSAQDILKMPSKDSRANYEHLYSLMLSRRSIRSFSSESISKEIIEKIIDAATTAPMGIPPSGIEVLVFEGREKVDALANDLIDAMESFAKILSFLPLTLFKPFIGTEKVDVFKNFVIPLAKTYSAARKSGDDDLFYKAPLVMYFYGTAFSDPADAHLAGTYAMLAAETLGLGTCVIGAPPAIFQNNRKLRKKYGISEKHQPGMTIIFGYPKTRFLRAIKRRFAKVIYP